MSRLLRSSAIEPSDKQPQYIGEVGWNFDVPTQAGKWGSGPIRGVVVWFSLLDKQRRITRSDGEVTIQINDDPPNILSRVFKTTFNVRKEDFRQSTKDPEFFGFWYRSNKAILYDGPGYRVEIWFKTPDGRKIYGS